MGSVFGGIVAPGLWKKESTLAINGLNVISTFSKLDFNSGTYIIQVINTTNNISHRFMLNLSLNGSNVEHEIFSMVGSSVDVEVTSSIVGQVVELGLINNETYSLNIDVVKLLI